MMAALAIAIGILLGAFSGLMPGIHSNTVASVLSGAGIAPEIFAYIIAAVLGAHLVFQFFPSIFLAIPDDTVVASVLPGNRMALEGRGREAAMVCICSSIIAAGSAVALTPAALALLPAAYSLVEPNTAIILVLASLFLLSSEKKAASIASASFVFLLSGALGMATLRSTVNDPLFPAFSGLFAASGIILSFTKGTPLPKQENERSRLDFLPHVAAGVALGMLSDLLPGIAAPAQIAVFASAALPTGEPRKFLALVASISAAHTVFAFSALVSIGKAREGALAIMEQTFPVDAARLPLLLGALLLSMGISAYAMVMLSRRASVICSRLEGRLVGASVLAYLAAMVLIISGAQGMLVFATATAIGILPPLLGVKRTHVMGLIIIPSIALALGSHM